MPEGVSTTREELKVLKRQAAIRAKEDEFERKRKQDEEQKRADLQALRDQFEAQEQQKVQDRLKHLENQAQARARRKARIEQLNERREQKIAQRNEAWLQKANSEIQDIIAEHEAENERVEQALEEARNNKREKDQEIRDRKTSEKDKREELDMYREEAESERKSKRELRGIYKADLLKTEATEELESFILNPYPVPLKQVLAGKLRPVPTVTQLLAAYKDQKEDLKELEEQDIPTRAMLRKQTLFQYVRDLQLKAEKDRIKPPEPQMADLGRSRNRTVSPKNKFRAQGTMRSTR